MLGHTALGAEAIATIAAQLPRDVAGLPPKGSVNLSHGELLKWRLERITLSSGWICF